MYLRYELSCAEMTSINPREATRLLHVAPALLRQIDTVMCLANPLLAAMYTLRQLHR